MRLLRAKTETARLEKLRSFEILDTAPERTFNRIVRMTAQVFRVPICAVTFVDEYRCWNKASCGLRQAKNVFREHCFCSRTIRSDGVTIVSDASLDPEFARLPIVGEAPRIRFYAGAPLVSPDGYRLGALCVMDRLPRAFGAADSTMLAELATIVIDKLMLRRVSSHLNTEISARKREERTLTRQHRLLQRLSASLEESIRQRTAELTSANDSLRAEISRRVSIERDRASLLGLVEESPDLIALATPDAIPQYINPAGRRLLGLDSLKKALRIPFREHFRPEDRAFVETTVLSSLRRFGQWEGDFHFRHSRTGALLPVNLNLFYVRDPASGAPLNMAFIARDIAERKRTEKALREGEERFRHLVEQAGDAFFLCDLDGRIVDVNQAACTSLGLRREELLGHPIGSVEATFNPAEALPRWREWEPGRTWDTRGLHRRRDGTTFPVEARLTMIYTDGQRYILALVRDVTGRLRADAALQHAKEEAEKANRAKSEFLSRMSHELRTPLNAILGFGQILLARAAEATQKECATHVVNAGHHLLDLINEVLDIARIETGQVDLSLEPIPTADLVAETLDLIRPQAYQRGITFDVSLDDCGDSHLLADRKCCKQVLLNILSNAVKYSPEGGCVRIECRTFQAQEVRICVSDSGPGIPADKIERLFVAFDRLGAELSEVPGTGLGLTLSKYLVEAMGGSIGLNSTPGEGSTFWLQLPQPGKAKAPPPPPPPALIPEEWRANDETVVAESESAPISKVLYIEDNASNVSLMEHLFFPLPQVRLITAHSGKEGLNLARSELPQLVLLDLHLPDIPGHEVLARLQSDERTRQISVVALSADAMPDTIERLLQTGARAYLTKPLDIPAFYQLLSGLGLK